MNDHLSGKELFFRITFRKLLSIYVFISYPFGFEGRIWDLIVSVPDHCLSVYFLESLQGQLGRNNRENSNRKIRGIPLLKK